MVIVIQGEIQEHSSLLFLVSYRLYINNSYLLFSQVASISLRKISIISGIYIYTHIHIYTQSNHYFLSILFYFSFCETEQN